MDDIEAPMRQQREKIEECNEGNKYAFGNIIPFANNNQECHGMSKWIDYFNIAQWTLGWVLCTN